MATKKAVKPAQKDRARTAISSARNVFAKSKRVAKVVEPTVAPLKLSVTIDSEELLPVTEAAMRLERATVAVKELNAVPDPGEKRLHRRVLLLVYDGTGTRMSNTSYDLSEQESLSIQVSKDSVSAITRSDRA